MPEPVDAFPVIQDVLKVRQFLTTAPLAKFAADLKAAADAINAAVPLIGAVTDDAAQLADIIRNLFGTSAVGAAPVGGFLRDRRHARLIQRVKEEAEKIVRTEGLAGIEKPAGWTPRLLNAATWDIEEVWEEADRAGASAVILDELSRVDGYAAALGGLITDGSGTFWERLKAALENAWAWIVAHQDQIIAAAKILLMFLMMFGFL